MGCDIHIWAEVRKEGKWLENKEDVFSLNEFDQACYKKEKNCAPFGWRHYSLFGFLCGVRNYSRCTPINECKGFPEDSEYLNSTKGDGWDEDSGYHSHSWLTLKELVSFDYEKTFLDRRFSKQISPNIGNGREVPQEEEGTIMTYRELLGEWFFKHLDEMKQLGPPEDVRIVFCFDN